MTTKRISVTEFLSDFSDIDDINYTHKIIVFFLKDILMKNMTRFMTYYVINGMLTN